MRNIFIYSFTIVYLLLFTACSSSQPNTTTQISSDLVITGGGIVDGIYLWVTCNGHSKKTEIIINGQICETTYYEDHLTCKLPFEDANRDDVKYQVELIEPDKAVKSKSFDLAPQTSEQVSIQADTISSRSSIYVSSYGYGDKSSIWIQCKNHSSKARLVANSTELVTVYYIDHLTASLPSKLISSDQLLIQIKDSLFLSPEFILKK